MTYSNNHYSNGGDDNPLAGFMEPRAAATTEPENVAYEDPREIRQSLDLLVQDFRNLRKFMEAMALDIRDIKSRMTNSEQGSAGVLANMQTAIAICNRRIDRLEQWIAQAENRRNNQY